MHALVKARTARWLGGSGLAIGLLVFASATLAAPAARLELFAWPLTSREGEGLFANALRAPADSAGLATALLRAEARLQGQGWLEANMSAA